MQGVENPQLRTTGPDYATALKTLFCVIFSSLFVSIRCFCGQLWQRLPKMFRIIISLNAKIRVEA